LESVDDIVNDAIGNPIGYVAFLAFSFLATYLAEL
jgi:hypothetical protein